MVFFEMAGLENTHTRMFKPKPDQQLSYFVQTLSWLGAVKCPCHGHILTAVHGIALHHVNGPAAKISFFDPLCSRGPEHELLSSSDPANQENTCVEPFFRIRI